MHSTANVLVLLKPDAIKHRLMGVLIGSLEHYGEILKIKMDTPTRFVLTQHYKDHIGKDFFEPLIEFMMTGPLCAIQIQGDVTVIRSWVHNVRTHFPTKGAANLVHASDSVEAGERECKLWFP